MQQQPVQAQRAYQFPVVVGGLGAVWLLLALVSWLSGVTAARVLLALFTGGVFLAGFAWYCAANWAWRTGRAKGESCRQPVTLFLFGWLLCLGAALASGGSGDTPSPEVSKPATPVAPPPGKIFPNGPRRYLSDLEEFFVQAGPWPIGKNGVLNDARLIRVGGKGSPKGLSQHPPAAPGHSAIKYRLHKEAALFKAVAAVDDSTNFCWTPAIFKILGDDKELWQSKYIAHNHARTQDCLVDVTGVDVLELRVQCLGHNLNVYAVWVEPRLLQKTDTEDR